MKSRFQPLEFALYASLLGVIVGISWILVCNSIGMELSTSVLSALSNSPRPLVMCRG